jgi:hypothetical protein
MTSNHLPRGRLLALLALVAVASGCAKFRAHRKLDMQPFAENTVTAMGEMRRLDAPPIWVRLRPLYDHPAVAEARREAVPMRELVKSVTLYSLQLVSLNESRVPDPQKAKELARFIRAASQQALGKEEDAAEISLTHARLDTILGEIERSETYMGALTAAEPIVNAVLARGLALTDVVDAAIVRSAAALEREVQARFGAMLANRAALLAVQERSMKGLAIAERIGFGDEGAADELRQVVPLLAEILPPGRKAGMKEVQAALGSLGDQLARVKAALDQIEPQYQAYRESVLELDTLRSRANEQARLARSVLMLWARSHKNLAHGVEVPPAFDLAKIIGNSAGGALDKVVPF